MARDGFTDIGRGEEGGFPATRWSVIRDAGDRESTTCRASLESLAGQYWRPVYAHFRRKWGRTNEEAKDLTQEFFARLCEKDFLERLSPERGRFRSYVMSALDNFVRMEHRREGAAKRGGGLRIALEDLDGFEPASTGSPEDDFQREWARTILAEALDEVEAEYRATGKEVAFRIFLARDVEPAPGEDTSYQALAARFGVSANDVTNWLFRVRKRLREALLARVRETVSTEGDVELEMRDLLGP